MARFIQIVLNPIQYTNKFCFGFEWGTLFIKIMSTPFPVGPNINHLKEEIEQVPYKVLRLQISVQRFHHFPK